MVCTSSFGTGLDFPSIRIIFHCTIPPSVSELLQNYGRGGRDGLPYNCYLFFSYKRIHECAQTWMTAQPYTQEQLEKKWNMFVQMVKYTMSTICRRAYLLPMFDANFDTTSTCHQCDNCMRSDAGCEMFCDISKPALIILKVIEESTRHNSDGISMSRVRDIILGLTPRANKGDCTALEMDRVHSLRGIGLTHGYSGKTRQLWSMLSTYLIYAIEPSLLKETVSAVKGLGFTTLLRKVSITSQGSSTLTFSRPVQLRYPIDLMVMASDDANDFLNGASPVVPQSRKCTADGCQDTNLHGKGMCKKHYQKQYHANRKTPVNASGGKTPTSTAVSALDRKTPIPPNGGVFSALDLATPSANASRNLGSAVENTFTSLPPSPVPCTDMDDASSFSLPAIGSTPPPNAERPATMGSISQETACPSSSDESETEVVQHVMNADDECRHAILSGQFLPGSNEAFGLATEIHTFQADDPATWSLGWAKIGYTVSCSGGITKKYKCLGCWCCPDPKCEFKS